MSISRSRHSPNDTHNSDALADIALNTLGLILIVMLIYILLFRQTAQRNFNVVQSRVSQGQSQDFVATSSGKTPAEIAEMESQLTDLKTKLDQEHTQRNAMSLTLKEAKDALTALTRVEQEHNEEMSKLHRELANAKQAGDDERKTASNLQLQIQQLKTRIDTLKGESAMSGLWRFRNNVEKLVDHNDDAETVDWTIDYFLYLNVVDGKVTGALFGAHEIKTADTKGNSQSFATIKGTMTKTGFLDVELVFSQGTQDSGSEHLRCQLEGNEFIGRLESGRHRYGYRNYVGPTRGTRLTESVFK